MTPEALKAMLSSPISLLVLMLVGTMISMLKQYADGKANGSAITLWQYIAKVETVIAVGANLLAFFGLIMTDTLNWTGALAIGYALNSASDMVKPGAGRSADIVDKTP